EGLVDAVVLPKGALQFVCGGTGDLLERLGPQDVLAFTGSGTTGALLRGLEAVVHRSTRINVEADSLNAAILGPDVQVGDEIFQFFVRDVAKEITQKSGQKCTAIRRIFVPPALVEGVIDALGEALGAVPMGDAAAEGVRMGPLATADQRADVLDGTAALEQAGAKRVWGDPRTMTLTAGDADRGYFVAPCLFSAEDARSVPLVHSREVFGPVATVMSYRDAADVVGLAALGEGALLSAVYGNDRDFLGEVILGLAPHHGRVFVGSKKIVDQAMAPGLVLPSCVHGGPGRAGGGEELGGLRGMSFYMQRTAVQGDRALLDRILGSGTSE
ncbi:MAG: aldehyde dehydrogenase family protein, partial [Myxococcales bacterium]|nr:aldehyde dehydrogenase family protein [Myxococcales bacterium]